jgi:2-polyprenyl-3-methyl-5-hydroxy-6-metoxy-1,4-benzoquinol methylase
MKPKDRIEVAIELCRGKRVLDIGGSRMEPDATHPFDKAYRQISVVSKEYKIADINPQADAVVDLNTRCGVLDLAQCLAIYRPDVILCMETLEHLNRAGEVMDFIASHVQRGAVALITLPNNDPWTMLVRCEWMLGWMRHHLVAFTRRNVARNFITASALRHCAVAEFDAIGKQYWFWPLLYLAAGCQGFSFGYIIQKKENQNA